MDEERRQVALDAAQEDEWDEELDEELIYQVNRMRRIRKQLWLFRSAVFNSRPVF